MLSNLTLNEVDGLKKVFDLTYLNYKNINSYLDSVDDDNLEELLDDILECFYRNLTTLISILNKFQSLEEENDE